MKDKNLLAFKRTQDAAITEVTLGANRDLARIIAGRIAIALELEATMMDTKGQPDVLFGSHFYLKGGNGFNILQDKAVTGDYDFQLALAGNKKLDDDVDSKIRSIIRSVAMGIEDEIHNKELVFVSSAQMNKAFEPSTIKGETDNKIEFVGDCNGEMLTGANLKKATYEEMLTKLNDDGRVTLDKNDTVEYSGIGKNTPQFFYMYTNYAIPEFILYRLVYAKKYKINGKDATLKSEIIDISVPRAGSPEKYMSQDGVITHFLVKDGFRIPGWGYHFYENINLLQEIAYNTSASKHKRGKRLERLGVAIKKLCESNSGDLKNLLESTMYESGDLQIQGLAGACTYWLNVDFQGKNLFDNIRTKMQEELKSHIVTLLGAQSLNEETLVDVLSKLSTPSKSESLKVTVQNISSDLSEKVFNSYYQSGKLSCINLVLDKNNPKIFGFPVVFLTYTETDDKTDRFINMSADNLSELGYQLSDNGYHLFKRSVHGGTYYIVATKHKFDNTFKQILLGKTILYSQRKYLQGLLK